MLFGGKMSTAHKRWNAKNVGIVEIKRHENISMVFQGMVPALYKECRGLQVGTAFHAVQKTSGLETKQKMEYRALAADLLSKATHELEKGMHGMYISKTQGDKEYIWVTAAVGILHCITGDKKKAAEHLRLIKANASKDESGQFTLVPGDTSKNSISHIWVSLLAAAIGDLETAKQQGFSAAKNKRDASGLYISDSGNSPQTHMNALIGLAYFQKGEKEAARELLSAIENKMPKCKNGIHTPSISISPDYGTLAEAVAPLAMLKTLVLGPDKAEEYCNKVALLHGNERSSVLVGIMYALLSGEIL